MKLTSQGQITKAVLKSEKKNRKENIYLMKSQRNYLMSKAVIHKLHLLIQTPEMHNAEKITSFKAEFLKESSKRMMKEIQNSERKRITFAPTPTCTPSIITQRQNGINSVLERFLTCNSPHRLMFKNVTEICGSALICIEKNRLRKREIHPMRSVDET